MAGRPGDWAIDGTRLEGRSGTHGPIKATTHSMPFYDVDKKRRTAQGCPQMARRGPVARTGASGNRRTSKETDFHA